MSKRSAEENVAEYGDQTTPVSATRRMTLDYQQDGYNLTKKPYLSLDDERFHVKKRPFNQQQQFNDPLLLHEQSCSLKQCSCGAGPAGDGFLNLSSKVDLDKSEQKRERPCLVTQGEAKQEQSIRSCAGSKHLVKSLSDLPTFVSIEGFRVASYNIDGEPYLCLPNLLHFIQQKYPIEKAVDIFEETVTNFVSATPKQIEGFIKAIVLPPGAKSCPLIRRSDADRICLALFEQCSTVDTSKSEVPLSLKAQDIDETRRGSGSSRTCSPPADEKPGRISVPKRATGDGTELTNCKNFSPTFSGPNLQSTSQFSGSEATTTANNDNICEEYTQELSSDDGSSNKSTHINRSLQAKSFLENNWNTSRSPSSQNRHLNEKSSSLGSDDLTSTSSDSCYQEDSSNRERLFELEAQPTILNLARAATSTLIIHVYHRCFGKCNGYYYPSMFKSAESESIGCASCHRMLSPRRFIGHTHGSKETNVCHWGFNSYNWRHYIHLSRRQTLNKLDDDELIMQINKLKSAQDDNLGRHSEEEKRPQNRHSVDSDDRGSVYKQGYYSASDLDSSTPNTSQVTSQFSINLDKISHVSFLGSDHGHDPSTSKSHSIEGMMPRLEKSSDSCARRNPYHRSSVDQMTVNPFAPFLVDHIPNSKSMINNGGLNLALFPTNDPFAALQCGRLATSASARPTPPASHFDLTHFRNAQTNLPKQATTSSGDRTAVHNQKIGREPSLSSNNQSLPSASERLIKQDVFVSNGLTSYLHSRGLPSDLVSGIVDSTLNLIQMSRILF